MTRGIGIFTVGSGAGECLIQHPPAGVSSTEERADVLADALLYFDIESGFGRNFKSLAGRITGAAFSAVELDHTTAGHDFHPLSFVSAKMKLSRINQAESFFAAVREENGVTHNLAVEIDVGLGDRGDAPKFR